MRVIMTCGGTGGHINPAIAIADTIKKKEPDSEILFVGTKKGQEAKLVAREGYKIEFVRSEGIRRSLSPANIKAIIMAQISPFFARKIIKKFKPDAVIGTGGYACWPMLKAAAAMKIPCAVHESNAIPGMAVKMLEKSVDIVFTNFERTADFLTQKDKIVNVGNPLRTSFDNMEKNAVRSRLNISDDELFVLSYGGSGGSEYLNDTMIEIMAKYVWKNKKIKLVHATGVRNYAESAKKYMELGIDRNKNVELSEYIYDMHAKMAAADLVICRAGAMTLSELATLGKAAVIIPSPNVVDNHQYKNAKVLADANAAVLMEEKDVTPETLWEKVDDILSDTNKRRELENNIKQFARNDANDIIYSKTVALLEIRNA